MSFPIITPADVADAEKFRAEIHEEALQTAKKYVPGLTEVFDRNPVDSYILPYWDYPGAWYIRVGVPEKYKSRDALVSDIVKTTLEHYGKRR